MIFSQQKWNTEGVQRFVNASAALSFETMQAPLNQAWSMFLVPLLGDDLAARIVGIADKAAAERDGVESEVLLRSQNAVANLALWYNYTELNVRLTDQGHQRQESETFKNLFKYQANELRLTYRNKGFNAIDGLLEYIDSHADTFTEWAEAPANCKRKLAIVRDAKEVNKVVFINNSSIIFLRLEPLFRRVEETVVPNKIGRKLLNALKAKLNAGADEIDGTNINDLRLKVGKVIICLAVAELIRETGNLTDRGLYFATLTPGKEGDIEAAPATGEAAAAMAMNYDAIADRYTTELLSYVSDFLPDYYEGRPEDVFKRDNDGKRSVWL